MHLPVAALEIATQLTTLVPRVLLTIILLLFVLGVSFETIVLDYKKKVLNAGRRTLNNLHQPTLNITFGTVVMLICKIKVQKPSTFDNRRMVSDMLTLLCRWLTTIANHSSRHSRTS